MSISRNLTAAVALLILGLSCTPIRPAKLQRLPSAPGSIALDSVQSGIVFEYAQHFPNGTQLSICIIRGDSERYAGIERRNDSLVCIDNADSVFEVGSITKTFTGTMLAKMVYDGKVRLDEPIKNIIPVSLKQSQVNGREVELVDLANHTSGLPFEPTNVKNDKRYPFDPYSPYRDYSTQRLYEYLSRDMVLNSMPGEKRLYSNLGGGLLGHALTLLSGRTYEGLLAESICTPLGMQHTFVEADTERNGWIVRGRDPSGHLLPRDGDCGVLTGAGGIKSSARDLAKYLRKNIADTTYFYLAQKSTKAFDEHFTGGLGWATYSESGKHHVGAFGATGGYSSGVIFERQERVGVVLLTNVSAFLLAEVNYTEKLCRALYDPLPYAPKR